MKTKEYGLELILQAKKIKQRTKKLDKNRKILEIIDKFFYNSFDEAEKIG